ncbi:glycosyltransferase [Mesobacillus subterraneus]|uniref:glycosyltransferase n=1 Tax=Mesobacillus subterraneus TaxID=285983 RepID=UPI001CFD5AFE|nr:glycosyltransferase [Mesobacillus subterraneus]
MITLALAMIVKNEQDNLKRCIDSVKNLVDEIIVIDTGSTDDTRNIALQLGAKVYDYQWAEHFSDARNYSISKASSDFILVLDADEYILANGHLIKEFISGNQRLIGRINIKSSYMENGEVREVATFVSRVFPNSGIYFEGAIHEQINSTLPRKNIEVIVGHDGYLLKDKTKRNLPLLLKELEASGPDDYLYYQIGKQYYLRADYFQANKFFSLAYSSIKDNVYFKPQLVLDYLYSLLRSKEFTIGLSIIETENEFFKKSADFHFVSGYFFMEMIFSDVSKYISYFPRIEEAYSKCLVIGENTRENQVVGTGSFLALYNLGVYYESLGKIDEAADYYQKATEYGYKKAIERLAILNKRKR